MSQLEAVTTEDVFRALEDVIDPEIGRDIVTLGLVYDVAVHDRTVEVTFTLTTPGCPMGRVIRGGIVHVLGRLPGVDEVRPHLVFDPPWHPGLIKQGAM